jgi:hypothetical protein
MTEELLLVRATRLNRRTVDFAEELSQASGLPTGFILDGRHSHAPPNSRPTVMLTKEACQEAGLFCPPDFAWRCGDYGLYLAAQKFPEAQRLWLVEYDVRFLGGPADDFFRFFAGNPADLLTTYFRPATPDWYWHRYALGRGVRPYRCVFPLLRLSRRGLDLMHATRKRHSVMPRRRRAWPNDEAFTATTLQNAGFACADFNGFGRTFYEAGAFSGEGAIDGDALAPAPGGVKAYHPVLFGDEYKAKVKRLAAKRAKRRPAFDGLRVLYRRALSRMTPW